MRHPALEWTLTLCRLVTGGLFLWAALTKVGDLHAFAEEVANYQLLPATLVPLVAATLPGIEIVASVALLTGFQARAGATIVTGMLLVFIVGLSQALIRGIDLTCGCFGGADEATWGTVWRDVLMLLPAVPIIFLGSGRLSLEPSQTTSTSA